MSASTCVFSKVLGQFAGVVLIRDESTSDVSAPTQEEKAGEKTTEGQEKSSDEDTKSKTAEETAAEENGESVLTKTSHFLLQFHNKQKC